MLIGLLLAPTARGADSDAERAKELEAVRAAIEERRARVEAFERRERGLLETLEEIEQSADKLGRQTARARERASAARDALRSLEGREEEIAARQSRTRDAMARRAVALYKTGEAGPVQALFSSGSLPEFLARSRALRVMLEHDQRLLAHYAEGTAALARTREEAAAAAAENEHALALATARGAELAAERRERRRILGEVREDRAVERAALQELEAAAVALEETLRSLRGRRGSSEVRESLIDFAARRGDLPSPVDAPLERGFGRVVDDEFRTETFRKGVDFGGRIGQPVRAVAPGEVRFAGWFRGYGRMLILDHGGGYFTVLGHLDELLVDVGDGVGEEEVVATMGETGSLSGPRLYFEIRRGAEPLDPAEWLRP